jgi:hypothetical protein
VTPLVGELEAELANLRAEHQSDPEVFIELYDGTIVHWCTGCRSDWPCPTARALDAFDVERSRSERYREALEAIAVGGEPVTLAEVDLDHSPFKEWMRWARIARAALSEANVEVEEG